MKIFSKFLILLLTVVSVFSIKNVSADTPDIVIKDMTISEKSDTIIVNDYGFNVTTMNSNVTFYDIGDYVTYKIVLKNNTNNTYSINGLTDNNENSNVTYEYNSNEEKVLEANKELDIYITVKYTTELAPGETSVSTGNIDIVLDMSEVKNPNTSDNIIMLFIMLTLSALSVILIKNKKAKYLTVIAISLGLIIPTVLAKETFKLTINSTYNVGKTAMFKTGKDVNYQMKVLAGMPDDLTWQWYDGEYDSYYYLGHSDGSGYWESSIINVVKATKEEYEAVKDVLNEDNIVSTEDSKNPIYMWYDSGVVYYYSEADIIYLNSDASYMFNNLYRIQELDLSNFYTSKVTNMSWMFAGCDAINGLDVSGFDTSKVTDMSFMFYGCQSITSLDVSDLDTRQVTNMSHMFECCYDLTILDVSGFDTSKATDMSNMFKWCRSLTELNVSSFDTSKVTNMSHMFECCYDLTILDVSDFDTRQVTNMSYMFYNCNNVTDLDVSGFDTSQVTDMSWMFAWCNNLTELAVSDFDTSQVMDMSYMFASTNRDYINEEIITGWTIKTGCNQTGMFAMLK